MGNETLDRVSRPINRLLVEGKDDEHVLYSLLEHYHIPQRFDIKNKEGVTNILETLDVELDSSGLGHLGIIVDANGDFAARWTSIRDRLLQYGYQNIPSEPFRKGTIITEDDRPVVGIWLMPDNKLPGMLEDFVRLLIPSNDMLWPIAEEVVQRVIEKDCRFPQTQVIKANIHTWLAWQKEPGKPMGQAITKRYFDVTTVPAQEFLGWIRQLFDL